MVLSTRNRGGAAAEAVRTILANEHPNFEAIVIDQSDDDRTWRSLEPFLDDPRLRYLRHSGSGRSAGQNTGILQARGSIVLFTDDDCTVPASWVREFSNAFAAHSEIGIVFGNVLPAAHDSALGCIPAYVRGSPCLASGIRDKWRVEGIGACMGVRREVWESLGGFDEMLGAGARFRAGEDGDLAVRALLAGHRVYETPAVQVTHHGLRSREEVPDLIDGYWMGTGAMLSKALRISPWRVLPLLFPLAVRWAFGRSAVGASLGHRPERMRKLRAFRRGFLAGFFRTIDRHTGLYVPDARAVRTDSGAAGNAGLRPPVC